MARPAPTSLSEAPRALRPIPLSECSGQLSEGPERRLRTRTPLVSDRGVPPVLPRALPLIQPGARPTLLALGLVLQRQRQVGPGGEGRRRPQEMRRLRPTGRRLLSKLCGMMEQRRRAGEPPTPRPHGSHARARDPRPVPVDRELQRLDQRLGTGKVRAFHEIEVEKALDHFMNTVEVDIVITEDNVPVINHDLSFDAKKCRRRDKKHYQTSDEKWIYNLSSRYVTNEIVCDKKLPIRDRKKIPSVSAAFSKTEEMPSAYSVMTLYQLLKFVKYYEAYYTTGEGKEHPQAAMRAKNASLVKLHLEVKRNPRSDVGKDGKRLFERSAAADHFAFSVGWLLRAFQMEDRARLQSFDFNTLLVAQEYFPEIQTVYLFGDHPRMANEKIKGNSGTNLQGVSQEENAFLAGMEWPYRQSWGLQANKIRKRGGISGLTINGETNKIYAILEKPMMGEEKALRLLSFDLNDRRWREEIYTYELEPQGSSVDALVWVGGVRFLALERDGKEGDLGAYKMIFDITLDEETMTVVKKPLVDLMHIFDPNGLAKDGLEGDLGRAPLFSLPFSSIGGLAILDRRHLALVNDNNYPVGRGRHVKADLPDDSEFVIIQLARPLW